MTTRTPTASEAASFPRLCHRASRPALRAATGPGGEILPVAGASSHPLAAWGHHAASSLEQLPGASASGPFPDIRLRDRRSSPA